MDRDEANTQQTKWTTIRQVQISNRKWVMTREIQRRTKWIRRGNYREATQNGSRPHKERAETRNESRL